MNEIQREMEGYCSARTTTMDASNAGVWIRMIWKCEEKYFVINNFYCIVDHKFVIIWIHAIVRVGLDA